MAQAGDPYLSLLAHDRLGHEVPAAPLVIVSCMSVSCHGPMAGGVVTPCPIIEETNGKGYDVISHEERA